MRYLIDTNIFLFYASDREQLDKEILQILEDYENQIYISSESVKEVIHLFQQGRIQTKKWKSAQNVIKFIEDEIGFVIDYTQREHLQTLACLEPVKNHNDPNDRLIIAQAIAEKIPLISSDRKFELYRKQQLHFIFNRR
ncbi:MAG: type II toxin-antitoxin system VapC family toxin [Candidatus Azobacteroides sp.]|nr:type II toxin-antitoxin system VapC family toxin [Candidatus Azobacteroides sp.]